LFQIERDPHYMEVHVIAPCMMFSVVSYIQFWIDSAAVPARAFLAIFQVWNMLRLTQQVSESVPQTAQSMWLDNFVTFSMLLCNCAAAHFGLVQYCRIRESHREVQRAGLRNSKATVNKLTDTARRHGLAFLSLMQKFVPQERMLTQAELDEKERLARAEEAMADALDQADEEELDTGTGAKTPKEGLPEKDEEEVGLEVPLEPLPEWPLPASAVLVETPPQLGAGGVAQAGSQVAQQTVTEVPAAVSNAAATSGISLEVQLAARGDADDQMPDQGGLDHKPDEQSGSKNGVVVRMRSIEAKEEGILEADLGFILYLVDIFNRFSHGDDEIEASELRKLLRYFNIYMSTDQVTSVSCMYLRDTGQFTTVDEKHIRMRFTQVAGLLADIDSYIMRRKRDSRTFIAYFQGIPPSLVCDVVMRGLFPLVLFLQLFGFFLNKKINAP